MNVWALKAHGWYAGGMAIIAAPSKAEVLRLGATIVSENHWAVAYGKPESIELLPVFFEGEEPCVLVHYEMGE